MADRSGVSTISGVGFFVGSPAYLVLAAREDPVSPDGKPSGDLSFQGQGQINLARRMG